MYPSAPYYEEPCIHTPVDYPQTYSPNNSPSGEEVVYDNPDYDKVLDLPKKARRKALFDRYLHALEKIMPFVKTDKKAKELFKDLSNSFNRIEPKKTKTWANNMDQLLRRIKMQSADRDQVDWLRRYLFSAQDQLEDIYDKYFGDLAQI